MKLSNWRYLLPNLITTIATIAGFYAIVMAIKNQFDTAFFSIFIAFFADGFDGKIARWTHTQSEFGIQYDSLSDMAAFGIAPAVILYCWSLFYLGDASWMISCIYAIATAVRLARFNVLKTSDHQAWFRGLACPMAAGMIASSIWLCSKYHIQGTSISLFIACLTLLLAVLMISAFPYHSMRDFGSKTKTICITVIGIILLIVAITMNLPELFFSAFFIYMLSGPIMRLLNFFKLRG